MSVAALTVSPPSTAAHHAVSVRDLAPWLTGRLITTDDPDYDTVRRTISFRLHRRPLAIVPAATAADVAVVVSFAGGSQRWAQPRLPQRDRKRPRCRPFADESRPCRSGGGHCTSPTGNNLRRSRQTGPRPRCLPACHPRPAGGDQAPLRPGQSLPLQPERPATSSVRERRAGQQR